MKINDIGEFEFIKKIKPLFDLSDNRLIKGIGDDCAVLAEGIGQLELITTDILIEEIHFKREYISPRKLGRKSLAVNLSDIAAMGGEPVAAVVSIAIPRSTEMKYLEELFSGIRDTARDYTLIVAGGDTSASPKGIIISIAVTGRVSSDEILYRSGAKPGQAIFITEFAGVSAAGLDALANRRTDPRWSGLIESHLSPIPQIAQGRIIASSKLASSLIDVSDGIVSDLAHICEESGTGAKLVYAKLPVSEACESYCNEYGLSFMEMALQGGEDYHLMGTADRGNIPELNSLFLKNGFPFFEIGEITGGKGILLEKEDGSTEELQARGFDHFKTAGHETAG